MATRQSHHRRRRHRRAFGRARVAQARDRCRGLRTVEPAEGGRRRYPDRIERHARPLRARSRTGARRGLGHAERARIAPLANRRDLELVRARRDVGTALRHAASDASPRRSPVGAVERGEGAQAGRDRAEQDVRRGQPDGGDLSRCASRTAHRPRRRSSSAPTASTRPCVPLLFGPGKPEFTGCVAWRGLDPDGAPAGPSASARRHDMARTARLRAALSGAAGRADELRQRRRARRLAGGVLGRGRHDARTRERLCRLARRRADADREHRDALQMGADGARSDG